MARMEVAVLARPNRQKSDYKEGIETDFADNDYEWLKESAKQLMT
jgi:hypothetical protein